MRWKALYGGEVRRVASVVAAAVLLVVLGGIGGARSATQDQQVCNRTLQVRQAIVEASGAANCSHMTERHLREVTALDLSGETITALKTGDFDGLLRLASLDLSGNLLASLPEGVFDELFLLRTLRLDNNLLTTVPVDVFDELFLLEELTLSGNPSLALPAGMFPDFSRFAGIGTNGDPPDNSGSYPRIQRFLTKHAVSSPEEFITALPTLHKQRFSFVYESEAAAQDHVSNDYPRFISWGPDGRFIFAWNTDPGAPSKFRDAVEFLRKDTNDWTAGVVDFSGQAPTITEPSSCQTCHGSLNKPLWGAWGAWGGTEFPGRGSEPIDEEAAARRIRAVIASEDPRIDPLDFDGSSFPIPEDPLERYLHLPGYYPEIWAVEEAGVIFALRHAEAIFQHLRDRDDYRQFAEETVCTSDPYSAREYALRPFSESKHNPAVLANTGELIQKVDGRSILAQAPDYHYSIMGEMGGAVIFLMVVDLWEQEPIVRRLYREVSNEDTVLTERKWMSNALLFYESGSSTAEDELIQKYRLQFGHGSRASLVSRARQNRVRPGLGMVGAFFFDGHLEVMSSRVCHALRNRHPQNAQVAWEEGTVVLRWDAPVDAASLTGYRVLRGAEGESLEVLVANTGGTATEYVDRGLEAGNDYEYSVAALYGPYPSPESNRTSIENVPTPAAQSPVVTGSTSFTVTEGDTAVGTLAASDEDTAPSDLAWSIAKGADQSHFGLTAAGALTFTAAKDFENPDDSGADGTYEVTVQVSDGTNAGSADLTVTLANRNEAPIANAGSDQTDVVGGSTVTLSGSGEDPDTGDSLSYAWAQTAGTTVTLGSSASAETTFTVPSDLSADEMLTFQFTVTDGGGLTATDTVTVSVLALASIDPDATREGAVRLDAEAAARTIQWLNYRLDTRAGDRVDYFVFALTQRKELGLGVRYQTINLDASVEDASGNTVIRSWPPPENSAAEWLRVTLDAGTWYVRVEAVEEGLTRYLLRFGLEDPPAAPVVTGSTAFTVTEGDTAVGTLAATDADTAAASLEWTITGGADRTHFRLSTAGALTFAAAQDYENPDDSGSDGTYEVTVRVSDGTNSDSAAVTVALRNRNEAPSADAGSDQTNVAGGSTVTLSGSGNDPDAGDSLSYTWTQTEGTTVTLSSASLASTTFTAPSNLPADQTLTFRLTVTDGGSLTATDTVKVGVLAPATTPPAVTGTTAFTVTEGNTAVGTLAATDADTAASDLAWSITGGADRSHFALTSAGALSFTAAKDYEDPDDNGANGTYDVTVQVSDGTNTGAADVTVTLANRNEPPSANAGSDQTDVAGGSTVTLSGSGEDPDAGDSLSYAWAQTAGTTVTLSGASSASATFTAPADLDADETLTFRLTVTDGGGLTADDSVAVEVQTEEPVAPSPTGCSGAVWSATLTVGGDGSFLGFGAPYGGEGVGALSDRDFTWRERSYRVEFLIFATAQQALGFGVSGDLGADAAELLLRVGPSLTFSLGQAEQAAIGEFVWRTTVPYAKGDDVAVCLAGRASVAGH